METVTRRITRSHRSGTDPFVELETNKKLKSLPSTTLDFTDLPTDFKSETLYEIRKLFQVALPTEIIPSSNFIVLGQNTLASTNHELLATFVTKSGVALLSLPTLKKLSQVLLKPMKLPNLCLEYNSSLKLVVARSTDEYGLNSAELIAYKPQQNTLRRAGIIHTLLNPEERTDEFKYPRNYFKKIQFSDHFIYMITGYYLVMHHLRTLRLVKTRPIPRDIMCFTVVFELNLIFLSSALKLYVISARTLKQLSEIPIAKKKWSIWGKEESRLSFCKERQVLIASRDDDIEIYKLNKGVELEMVKVITNKFQYIQHIFVDEEHKILIAVRNNDYVDLRELEDDFERIKMLGPNSVGSVTGVQCYKRMILVKRELVIEFFK